MIIIIKIYILKLSSDIYEKKNMSAFSASFFLYLWQYEYFSAGLWSQFLLNFTWVSEEITGVLIKVFLLQNCFLLIS
jgi:hypothetical protein